MRLQDTGLTFEDIKSKVDTYMIETYERHPVSRLLRGHRRQLRRQLQ